MAVGSSPVAVSSTSGFATVSSKEFLDIPETIECGFSLELLKDVIEHTVRCTAWISPRNAPQTFDQFG